MSGNSSKSSAFLCLVGISGMILIRPVWSAKPKKFVLDHYRSGGLYRDVFIVHASTLQRATRKARSCARRRNSF